MRQHYTDERTRIIYTLQGRLLPAWPCITCRRTSWNQRGICGISVSI